MFSKEYLDGIKTLFSGFFEGVVFALIVFAVATIILNLVSKWTGSRIKNLSSDMSGKRESTKLTLFRSFLRYFLYISACALILGHIGIQDKVSSVFVTAGIGGLVLSLGTQSIVKDILGGVSIALEKPYLVGDWVEIAGYEGEVEAISLRNTYLDALGKRIVVPNGKVESVVNYSAKMSHLVIQIPVLQTAPTEVALKAINEALDSFYLEKRAFLQEKPYVSGIDGVDRFAYNIAIICKTTSESQWEIERLLKLKVKQSLENYEVSY